jgi:O-antigen/teichoic acid export membrane protein
LTHQPSGEGADVAHVPLRERLRQLTSSRLVRVSATYTVSNVLNRAVPFLLLPVLTRILSPGDFGLVTMFAMVVNLALPLTGFSTDGAVTRQFFERDRIDFPRYVATCMSILVATVFALFAVVWLLEGPFERWTLLPAAWIYVAVVVAAGRFITQVVLALWQVQEKPLAYAAYHLVQTLLVFSVAIVLVVVWQRGWRGRALGDVVGVVGTAALGVIILWRGGWLRGSPSREYALSALRFGGGLVPHVYGAVLLAGVTDRLFVTHFVGIDATGVYAVALQLAMVIGVLEHSVNQAWTPWLYRRLKLNRPEDHALIGRITWRYNIVILALALLLAAASPWLLDLLVGPQFAAAAPFVFWLAIGAAFGGMYKMVVNQIFYMQRTWIMAVITGSVGVLNVFVTWLLVSKNGVMGASQAVALSQFALYAATAIVSGRIMRDLRSRSVANPSTG